MSGCPRANLANDAVEDGHAPPGTCSLGHTECVYAQRLGYLTPEELEAMDLIGTFAGKLRKIIGDGPCAKGDWAEAADKIHQLQTLIMAQAAVRAYPEMFRPLGGRIE